MVEWREVAEDGICWEQLGAWVRRGTDNRFSVLWGVSGPLFSGVEQMLGDISL